MPRSSRKNELMVSGAPQSPRVVAGKKARPSSSRAAATERERDVLLQLIPDQVFRITAREDGSVAVMDSRTATVAVDHEPVGDGNFAGKAGEPVKPTESLSQQLAHHGKGLMERYLESGQMQTLELRFECGGRATQYEIRTAACASWELLAVATDVTARKEAEASISRSLSEVARLNEILQNEASLHAEDEQIMDNAFAKLGKLLEDSISAIQMIVQQKDPPTSRHQGRVCKLACAIAREMGLDKGQVDTIGLAALLHDLGKVFIPTDTLNKPGKLTDEEFAAVKDSAETEFQILKTIDLFYPIADIVHQHHERLDGSGYPAGLKGDDILLEARIIAVADVVEAMVSDRPYRPALSIEAAMSEITTGKRALYDPGAVDACVTLFSGGRFDFDLAENEAPQEAAYSGA